MAQCSRAWLPLLLLVLACALAQSTYGSRPSPHEQQKPVVPSPVVHGTAEPRRHGHTEEAGATGHRGANAGDGAVATSAMHSRGVVVSEQGKGGAPVLQQALRSTLLSSKLARRVLRGEAEDSAAGPSCRSNKKNATCAPPAQH